MHKCISLLHLHLIQPRIYFLYHTLQFPSLLTQTQRPYFINIFLSIIGKVTETFVIIDQVRTTNLSHPVPLCINLHICDYTMRECSQLPCVHMHAIKIKFNTQRCNWLVVIYPRPFSPHPPPCTYTYSHFLSYALP